MHMRKETASASHGALEHSDSVGDATPSAVPAGEYGDRIARGAALLDEKQPGWRDRIDLTQLELSACTSCVLGQLVGGEGRGWFRVTELFGLSPVEAFSFGFALSDEELERYYDAHGWDMDEDVAYAQLTSEWKQYIEATR